MPNSLVGLAVFGMMTSAALAGLLGSRLSSAYLRSMLGISLFMTLFVLWYMEQTAFAIGALCLFCTASLVNILLTALGLTRVAAAEDVFGDSATGRYLYRIVAGKADLAFWFVLVLLVAMMLIVGLGL